VKGHHSYRKPDYLARLSAAMMGNTNGNDAMRRYAAMRVVAWTDEMRAVAVAHYIAGRAASFIAEDIGVARSVLKKEFDRLELARGRWVGVKTRRSCVVSAVRRGMLPGTVRQGLP
jgi:hypothetical protein